MSQYDNNVQPFESIDERDLHAYVDGLLDAQRARQVQEYLKRHPDKCKQVADYRQYNELLRQAHQAIAQEPVPARLLSIVNRPRQSQWPSITRLAAVGALCVVSAAGGWLAAMHSGLSANSSNGLVQSFLQQVATNASAPFESMTVKTLHIQSAEQIDPLNWLTQKVALEMQAPNLTAAGYTLQSRRLITRGSQEFVELTYANSSGDAVMLYMKTRWEKDAPTIEFVQKYNQSIAFWQEGPLVYALSGALNRDRAVKIAELVRSSMTSVSSNPPQVQDIRVMPVTPSEPMQITHGYEPQSPLAPPQARPAN